jgi:hypothetical protein
MPNWILTPDAPGYWWWRENATSEPFIRDIRRDNLGLYDAAMKILTIQTLGGQWQRVAPPLAE